MYSKVNTFVLQGLRGIDVLVETDLSRGLPLFNIVGLADVSIKESKERVRTAIKNSGLEFPLSRITINLAPANIKKEGSQLDLAIAIGILKSNSDISKEIEEGIVCIGELSLEGNVMPVIGALAMVSAMKDKGYKKCILPYKNRRECSFIDGIEIIPVKTLKETMDYLNGQLFIKPYKENIKINEYEKNSDMDFSEIKGQETLKRVMEISAAGFHNLLIFGGPGSGKTMAAKRLSTILPNLSKEEAIDISKIYSICGLIAEEQLINNRPFRSPHHTSSPVSLIGGGKKPKPGEVSLSHNGVLFLDELPEFKREALEALREPLEEGVVHISRINGQCTYPADFIFITALNPCPCGFYGDNLKKCKCSPLEIRRYMNKVSNPLMDRIDMYLEVLPVKYSEITSEKKEEKSEDIRKRVEKARLIQMERYKDECIKVNGKLKSNQVKKYCKLTESSKKILGLAFDKYKLSARSYDKILKVARTIADLDNSSIIKDEHLLEAISYKSLNL